MSSEPPTHIYVTTTEAEGTEDDPLVTLQDESVTVAVVEEGEDALPAPPAPAPAEPLLLLEPAMVSHSVGGPPPPSLRGERPLLQGVRGAWTDESHADVTLVCGFRSRDWEREEGKEAPPSAPEGAIQFRAHRLVLSTLSYLLGASLLSDVLCCPCDEDSVVLLPDLDQEEAILLKNFLERAYRGGFDEVRVPQTLEYLGFAEQMVAFRPPVPPKTKTASSEETEEEDLQTSQYAVATQDGFKFLDDPELDPKTAEEARAMLKTKVKLQMEPTVEDRENQILQDRSSHPKPVQSASAKRAKPGTSQIWNFFRRARDKKHSICKECSKKFRNTGTGTTSTLVRHIKGTHPELHESYVEMTAAAAASTGRPNKVAIDLIDDEEMKEITDRQPKTFAKRSPVWKHFSFISKVESKCLVCEEKVTTHGTATSYLLRHLEARHPEELAKVKEETKNRKSKQQEQEELATQKSTISVEKVDTRLSPIWNHFEQESLHKVRCMVCKQTVRSVDGNTTSALRHLRRRHPELAGKENFYSKELLTQFFSWPAEGRSATCNECSLPISLTGTQAASCEFLVKHLRNTHPEAHERLEELQEQTHKKCVKQFVAPTAVLTRAAIWNYFDETGDKVVHACKACRTTLSCKKKNASNLARHLRVAHERLYRQYLIDCGYEEDQIDEIVEKHSIKRGPKPQSDTDLQERTCSDCDKIYSTKKGMQVHQLAVHSGARPFECEECGMTFARKESFKRHNHTGDKPFLCSVCGKTFARRHIRDIHERAHNGEKRYGCGYCDKRFTTNQKKTIHERIHTGEKPYECQDCGKKFVQMHQLQTHVRIHTGARPYRCDHCNQMFRHLSTRAKHNCPGRPRHLPHPLGSVQPTTVAAIVHDDPTQASTTTTIIQEDGEEVTMEEEGGTTTTQHIEVYDENGIRLGKQEAIVMNI